MLQLQFPQYNFRIKKEGNKHLVFDEVRRRWVTLSPEEWVRQNFLQYLVQVKHYPLSLISVEKIIKLAGLTKRYDVVVYQNNKPWMVVECKETNTPMNTAVIEQILRYNMALFAKYFVITNGNQSFAYEIFENAFIEITDLPEL
jgi:hypothetical protein